MQDFENIKNSKSIRGIVINATGFSANPSISWEIREKLKELKKAGKRVIIFIERTGLEGYHFASVADEIVMDEMGTVSPSGYVIGTPLCSALNFNKFAFSIVDFKLNPKIPPKN